MSSIMLSFIQN